MPVPRLPVTPYEFVSKTTGVEGRFATYVARPRPLERPGGGLLCRPHVTRHRCWLTSPVGCRVCVTMPAD